jgi:PAS domain S-box-containing protein
LHLSARDFLDPHPARAGALMLRSLTARTVSALALLAVVVGGMFALLLVSVHDRNESASQSRAASSRVAAAAGEEKLLLDIETGVRGYLITGERRFLEPFDRARAALPAHETRLLALRADPHDYSDVGRIIRAAAAYLHGYAEPLAAARAPRSRRVRSRIAADGKERMDTIRHLLDGYVASELAESRTQIMRSNANGTRTMVLAGAGLVSSVMLVLLVAVYQLRSVLAPVRRAGSAARRVATGDLSVRLDERGAGEVVDLARSFNLMATSLEYTRDALERQNAELEAQQVELEMAVDDLARQKASVERFQRFGAVLAEEAEIEPLADTILQELGDVGAAEVGALYVYVEEAGEAALMAVRGLDPDRLPIRVRPREGLLGRALAEHRVVTASYEQTGLQLPTYTGDVATAHEAHFPLVQGERIVGVVTLGRVGDTPFSAADLVAIEQLAERASVGVSAAVGLRTLRNQAVLNRAVLDTAVDAFLSLNENGVIIQWNRAAERVFGFSTEAALGARLVDILIPERYRERDARILSDLVAGRSDWPLGGSREMTALHADGTELVVEAAVSPLRLGDRVQFNAFVRDVSERKRQERYREAVHRVTLGLSSATSMEEARDEVLRGLGDVLGGDFGATLIPSDDGSHLNVTGVWSSDRRDYSELEAAGRAMSLAPGEGIAGGVWQTGEAVFVDDFMTATTASSRPFVEAAELRSGVAFPVYRGSEILGVGEIFWSERRSSDPDMLDMLTTLGRQIGEFIARKRAESEADRLKDEFFALVSHELRTPLTSIIGYLELALEDDGVDEEPRHFLEVVQRNAGRLLRLVGDLLFVAQFEAGKLTLDPGPVDMFAVCSESVETARPKAEAADVSLRLDAERVPALTGDAGRLGQAIDNLVSNALKFTPAGGTVEVALRRAGAELVIEVRDDGIGIPEPEQERLFDRFFRSQSAHEQAVQGVGLGLTIVKAIVDGHDGQIRVLSSEGRGTRFAITLPLVPADDSHGTDRRLLEVSR